MYYVMKLKSLSKKKVVSNSYLASAEQYDRGDHNGLFAKGENGRPNLLSFS
jgi:hypothetical protein